MLPLPEPMLDGLLRFLSQNQEFVFLDTSRPDFENNLSLLFLDPADRLVCNAGDDLLGYLEELQNYLAKGYYLAGWVGYEFGALLEGGIRKNKAAILDSRMVVADLGVFLRPYQFNHLTGENNFPGRIDEAESDLPQDCNISNLHPNMTKEEFVSALDVVQEYIAAGDTYQVNYTMKLLFDFEGPVESFYKLLRKNQSVGYGAFIRNNNENILSFSPELFFKKSPSEITVRPMKGTAVRGRNHWEEQQNSEFLKNDLKNRSENVMIVDLLRNDLARVMHGHGQSRVFVESLFDVESYESLLQMTSTIKAVGAKESMQHLALTDFFRALFPCGSITGAPKIRTMQIIDELEKGQRGVYTGAIGYFSPDGTAAFNVPIRTVRLQGDKGEMGIGAGITHGSVPEDEWYESLLKGRFLTHSKPEFQIFETLLFQPVSGYYLLEAHLNRLEASAQYFKFSFDRQRIETRLEIEQERFGNGPQRVRITLEKDGRLAVEMCGCDLPALLQLPSKPGAADTPIGLLAISDTRVDTQNPWCFHKTTVRKIYNEKYQQAQEKGLFDYLFCNEKGQITEGCISNVFVYENGCYYTPPVQCGLLPGVMREELMKSAKLPVIEKELTPSDIKNAEAVYLCNSVRGVVRVELVGQ